jgi:peptide/nickel transport system substrate-binding protein
MPHSSRTLVSLLAGISLTAMLTAFSSTSSGQPTGTGTPVTGGTATVAQLFAPDYIFPMYPSVDTTNANEGFTTNLYRPLYYTPNENGLNQLNEAASAALPPVFSNGGKTATITLKSWKWSNGEPLSAANVVFFLNMLEAEKANYGLYIPGEIPDNIVSVKVDSLRTLTITFNGVYAQDDLVLNQLATITPMPLAWDLQGTGQPGDCATNESDCAAVYTYLTGQAKTPTSYASNPLWGIVDGPWKLASFTTDGSFTLVPNRAYSGSPKPRLSAVSFETFTDETSEYNVLRSGHSLDVGFLPLADAPAKPANKATGPNPVSGYNIVATAYWGAIGVPLNFNNPTVGPIIRQTYFRQALQSTVDQPGYIKAFLLGYGSVQTGPIPSQPPNPYQAAITKKGGPFPFDLAKAKSLLQAHGWKINPSGADTCSRPGTGATDCGAGITAGAKLSFTAGYVDSPAWIGQTMAQWKSDASKVGIVLSLTSEPFSTLYGATTECTPTQAACSWEISNFDGVGNYTYPVGALYFSKAGALNYGSYFSSTADNLINQTISSSKPSAMQAYDAYMAEQVPMIWFPMPVDGLDEVVNNLAGVIPSARAGIVPVALSTPEYWYFTK